MARIGIDLGGTKIEGVVLDDAGEIIERVRVPTPQDDYDATLEAVSGLVRDLASRTDPEASVGIGMPGSVSTVSGAMKNCNSTCLNGRFFQRDLEAVLDRPVAVANDADCFALSEAVDGAGADAGRVFGVILGTGVGGGIVQDKRLLAGPNGLCGEWGHNLLPQEGRGAAGESRRCYCGRLDCVETYLSGGGLAATYEALSGRHCETTRIPALARDGDEAAERALDLYVGQLAFALSQVINILDPDVIVLGGGLSNIEVLYEAVPPRLGERVFSDAVETRLVRARFGDSSGVRGAAWLPGTP